MPAPATSRLLRRMNAQRVLDARARGRPAAGHRAGRAHRAVAPDGRRGRRRPGAARLAGGDRRPRRRAAAGRRAASRSAPTRATSPGVDIGEVKVRAAVADLARRDRRRARARVRRRGAAADHPPHRARRRSKDAGSRARAAARRVRRLHRPDGPARPGACCSAASSPTATTSRARWRGTLGRRLVVENDCNLAVIAERWAARGLDDIVACSRASGSAPGSWSAASSCAGTPARPASWRSSASSEPGAAGSRQLVRRARRASAPEAVFAAAEAGDEEALGDRRARRALAGTGS